MHICDLKNPCLNKGACLKVFMNTTNSNASIDFSFQCACTDKYTGDRCELEKNACLAANNSNPCQNGASCYNELEGEFSCKCAPGYEGLLCEVISGRAAAAAAAVDMCAQGVCKNGATCSSSNSAEHGHTTTYVCLCPAGFTGNECQSDVDECASAPCLNGAVCVQSIEPVGYQCQCRENYGGVNCEKMIETGLFCGCCLKKQRKAKIKKLNKIFSKIKFYF